MNCHRWLGAALSCGLLAATLVATTAPARSQGATVVIPVVVSLTGQGAFLGKQQADTLGALEKSVNAHGGIKGANVHFDIQDDQTSPQVAVQLTNALMAKKPAAIIGSDLVGPCLAMSAAIKDQAVQYCTSPAIHPDAGSSTYSVGVSTFDIIADAIRYYRLHGEKRIALLTSTDATGQDIDHAVDNAMKSPENKDVKIVAREHFGTADLSVSAQLARIKAQQPQVVFGEATGPPFGTILQAVQDTQVKTPVFTSTGNMVRGQLAQYNHFGVNDIMFVGMRFFVDDQSGPGAAVVKQFTEALGATKADIGHGLAWDAGLLIVSAFQKLGPDATAAQVKAYINGLKGFQGVCGVYNFAEVPQRGLNGAAGLMMRWDPAAQTFVRMSGPGGVAL